jgi:hypothetical protein
MCLNYGKIEEWMTKQNKQYNIWTTQMTPRYNYIDIAILYLMCYSGR